MSDSRKVLLLQSSGGIYSQNNPKYSLIKLSRIYIKGIFVNGFDSFDIVRVKGTAVSAINKDTMLQNAINEIKDKFVKFYSKHRA